MALKITRMKENKTQTASEGSVISQNDEKDDTSRSSLDANINDGQGYVVCDEKKWGELNFHQVW